MTPIRMPEGACGASQVVSDRILSLLIYRVSLCYPCDFYMRKFRIHREHVKDLQDTPRMLPSV